MAVVRGYGYRCDSIASLSAMWTTNGFHVTCYPGYSYDVEDKGGHWVVTVE
jgi:hypothetical protein